MQSGRYSLPHVYAVILIALTGFMTFAAASTAQAASPYLVLAGVPETDEYYAAAARLAEHREAKVVSVNPTDLGALEQVLKEEKPAQVALVLRPEVIDTNYVRRFLLLSTQTDDDPFQDFLFGYITGRTGADALRFVENIVRAEKEGLPRKFGDLAVIEGSSFATDQIDDTLTGAGFSGESIYVGEVEQDPKVREFFAEHTKALEGNGILGMSGNGDPERIWLFDAARNADESKHWPYDPAKVGWDPKGEMCCLTADEFRGLNLYPGVAFVGPCHSGSPSRTFVESDIVSTFGTTDKVEVYQIPPEKSLALALLSSGATGLFLPVGANHGFRTLVEYQRMLTTGMSLGELAKSCSDELVVASGGKLEVGLYQPGAKEGPDQDINSIMRGGAANRVLYGDPAFRPFAELASPAVAATKIPAEDEMVVECRVLDPNGADLWNQFEYGYHKRIFAAVPLPSDAQGVKAVRAELRGLGLEVKGKVRWAEERTYYGTRRLHLLALVKADELPRDASVQFHVTLAQSEAEAVPAGEGEFAARAQRAAEQVDAVAEVRGVVQWFADTATQGEGGVLHWPQAEGSKVCSKGLYYGAAGVVHFLVNAAQLTGDEEAARLAKAAGEWLLASAKKQDEGITWEDEDEDQEGNPISVQGPGLYVGSTGIANALLDLYELTKDQKYLAGARSAGDFLAKAAQVEKDSETWAGTAATDIISGAAGTGLFLLHLHAITQEPRYLEAAASAGRWLIAHSVVEDGGRKWSADVGWDRYYTGFSHGTAGVAFFLARLGQASGDPQFLTAAQEGAKWLAAVEVPDDGGCKWPHYFPGHEQAFQTGWCHGPAGTTRLFLELAAITGDKTVLDTAEQGADWLLRTVPPAGRDDAFHNLYQCCGAAGIGNFFLDLFAVTGNEKYRDAAETIAQYLVKYQHRTGNGTCWTISESAAFSRPYYAAGFSIGTAGVGCFFARLELARRGELAKWIKLPDE